MKHLLGFIVMFSFVLILSPLSVSAGEMIEATCIGENEDEIVLDFDISGGKQNIAGLGESEVKFSKTKIMVTFSGGTLAFNITNGKAYLNGEHEGVTCTYENLAALEDQVDTRIRTVDNESATSASSDVTEEGVFELLRLIKTQLDRIEKGLSKYTLIPTEETGKKEQQVSNEQLNAGALSVGCMISEGSGRPDIWFSAITGGSFNEADYEEEGDLGITATVSGNGNTAIYSAQTDYKKVGNRLEIDRTWVTVPVEMEEFKEHFGSFPTLTCTSP